MEKINPKISILMPVYNGQNFLVEAVESVLSQTYVNFEFIIIDDGSIDGSYEILKKYADLDSRISLSSRQNMGVVFTRNELISRAQCDFIAWMDQDDISSPFRLEKQLYELIDKNADICGSHWLSINHSGKIINSHLVPLNFSSVIIYLLCSVPFAHGSVMIRSSFLKNNNISYGNYKYAEDCDFWHQMFASGAVFVNVNDFLYFYRVTKNSFSKINLKRNLSDAKKIRRSIIKNNLTTCINSIKNLLMDYDNLSELEKTYTLVSSYLLLIVARKIIIFDVLKKSTKKSIAISFLYMVRGL